MAIDANGEWNGICACGKKEADGVQCKYGATHQLRTQHLMPWVSPITKQEFPWQTT